MSVLVNTVRKGFYLDSVVLMRISRDLSSRPGVEAAALMIGSRTNKDLLREADLLAEDGEGAVANDLVIAVRAADAAAAEGALDAAAELLEQRSTAGASEEHWRPRSLRTALEALAGANLALISVPGEFAAAEARRALQAGLNVMLFSDNVPVEEECELKQEARRRGLLMMGPDCGTALLGGVPLAFANEVPRGPVGIVSASGTGLQCVSSLIALGGGGVSHGIGVGGRDLSAAVGGTMTLAAIDALDADPRTERVVLISKPPGAGVAAAVLERAGRSAKPFTICFLGAGAVELPRNARLARTLKEAAVDALGGGDEHWPFDCEAAAGEALQAHAAGGTRIRGLYCGGTLCAEAQIVLLDGGAEVCSNVPVPAARRAAPGETGGHCLLDLGADEYTLGRPHPMIDPALRDRMLGEALEDPEVAVVLLDLVIGHGAHPDPASEVAGVLARAVRRPPVAASVCGTEGDPQGFSEQVETLRRAGVNVAPTNADAAALAGAIARRLNGGCG